MRRASRFSILGPDCLPLDRGSARRVVPLVRLLAERYDEVRVISPGARLKRCESRKCGVSLPRAFCHRARLVESGVCGVRRCISPPLSRARQSARAKTMVALSQCRLPEGAWRARPGGSSPGRRLVLLEYPFWEKAVLASCAKTNRKSLLTMHDTLSDLVVGSAWLRAKVRSRELSAARKASSRLLRIGKRPARRFAKRGSSRSSFPTAWTSNRAIGDSGSRECRIAAGRGGTRFRARPCVSSSAAACRQTRRQ